MKPFTVISYNIHKGLSPTNRTVCLDAMADALAHQNPAVVCLQEVQGKHTKRLNQFSHYSDQQADFFAKRLAMTAHYGKNAVYGDDRHHGNATLSGYPIEFYDNVNLTVRPQEMRGLLHCNVHISGKMVAVLNCHLNLLHKDRVKQYDKIIQYINGLDDNMPLILTGDFNDWTKQSDLCLAKLGLVEVYQAMRGDFVPSFPAKKATLSLDRLYIRQLKIVQAIDFNNKNWQNLSDHLPVGAVLAL